MALNQAEVHVSIRKLGWFERAANAVQGRTHLWLIAFFVTGNLFHIHGKLDASYITFFTAFMGIALGHSIKEDYFSSKTTMTGDAANEEK